MVYLKKKQNKSLIDFDYPRYRYYKIFSYIK